MNNDRSIFAQIMDHFIKLRFHNCVRRYQGETKVRNKFSCLDYFYITSIAQVTFRESLRDIEVCLKVIQPKLYHMDIDHSHAWSTMAVANEKWDRRIFAYICQALISRARSHYA